MAAFTLNTSVATESQPAALVVVKVYVPAAVYACPFQVYGSCAAHTLTGVEEVVAAFTLNTSVATESQPAALVVVKVYEPAAVYACPFQVYGSCAAHTLQALKKSWLLHLNTSVATESQPAALVVVKVYEPAAVYACPFQVYGSCAAHTLTGVEEVVAAFTLSTSVATESQPAALVVVKVYEPAAVYACPFQVYGSCAAHTLTGVEEVVAAFTLTFVIHEITVQLFVTVHVIIEVPLLKDPLASFPMPFRTVEPVISKLICIEFSQLLEAISNGIV